MLELNPFNSEKLYIFKEKKIRRNATIEMYDSINYEVNKKNIRILYYNKEFDKKNINETNEEFKLIDKEIGNVIF